MTSSHPVEVAGGRMFGPGELISTFDAKDPHNAALIEDGHVGRAEGAESEAPAKSPEPESKDDE